MTSRVSRSETEAVVCPPEFVAVPTLASLGATIGNSYILEVKKGWKETFFNLRADPNPRLKGAGSAFWGTYVADKGFEGEDDHRRWLECYGAEVLHPPKRNSKKPWSKRLRRWMPAFVRS